MCSDIPLLSDLNSKNQTKSKHDADFADPSGADYTDNAKVCVFFRLANRLGRLPPCLTGAIRTSVESVSLFDFQCTGLLLTKYNKGNKKIQMMSTKCQYNPKFSTIV